MMVRVCGDERWAFTGWKVSFYGMKGELLRDERWAFTGWKVSFYGMKG